MVSYAQWNKAVHTAYKQQGGSYLDETTVQQVTQMAAEFWQENKEELLELAFDAAVELAMRALNV